MIHSNKSNNFFPKQSKYKLILILMIIENKGIKEKNNLKKQKRIKIIMISETLILLNQMMNK